MRGAEGRILQVPLKHALRGASELEAQEELEGPSVVKGVGDFPKCRGTVEDTSVRLKVEQNQLVAGID
jgi:hypothetical protein